MNDTFNSYLHDFTIKTSQTLESLIKIVGEMNADLGKQAALINALQKDNSALRKRVSSLESAVFNSEDIG